MKKLKLKILLSNSVLLIILPTAISCSSNKIENKIDDNDDKEDKDKEVVKHDFLTEIVNETGNNIDVNVTTFSEGLQVKAIYEQKIIELNNQNLNLVNNDNLSLYYKNLFYIVGYLRIIGKANQNISWLKFQEKHGDILENSDKEINFQYALYLKRKIQGLYGMYGSETTSKLRNFYFENVVDYQVGDLLTVNFNIPQNYLNFKINKIQSSDISTFYYQYLPLEDKKNIDKVFLYFKNKNDTIQNEKTVKLNDKALEKRGDDRVGTRHPYITDHTFLDGLITRNKLKGGDSNFTFNQITGEDGINS